MHVQLNANHIHSPPAEAAWIFKRRAQSAGTAGGGLDCVGLVSPLSSRLGSAWWVHADSRRRAPCAPTPSPPSRLRLRGAARAQHPPRASRAPKFLEGRRWPQSRPHSLPPSLGDARAPQRAAAAPPACAPRPVAAWSASAARARAGGSARYDPSTWATSSSPARPTPACLLWASGATTASAASPGTPRRPCGTVREGGTTRGHVRRAPYSHGLPPAPRVSALTQASCLGQAVPRWAVPPPTGE